jgi:26S proteasome regulatory subunit T3
MGDVAVENPVNHIAPHKKTLPSTIPSIENFEGASTEGGDDYAALKKLQRQLEYIQLQEEYIKDEQRCASPFGVHCEPSLLTSSSSRSLKRELVRAQEEIKRIQSVPLVIGQFMEAIDQK